MYKLMEQDYKSFTDKTALEWGIKYYGNFLVNMQNQNNFPQTPTEKFFRTYTQGIHYVFNRLLRSGINLEKYYNDDSFVKPEMICGAIEEIKAHPSPEDIIVYRYVNHQILNFMLKWSNHRFLRKGIIIFDNTFLSTTLTPDTVRERDYATSAYKLLKIYVPKNTPCLYLELIADMQENEVIFLPRTKLRILSTSILSRIVECIIIED